MNTQSIVPSVIIGLSIVIGLSLLGIFHGDATVKFKSFERTVSVKGLSEREVPADRVIWPITFQEANNDLNALFSTMQSKSSTIIEFLKENGITQDEISAAAPSVLDRYAQSYGSRSEISYRYTASLTVTVYSSNVMNVRKAMTSLITLGKKGIAIYAEDYRNQTQYLFTGLNTLKPEMIEEATKNARAVAEKFAADSESSLGKIKTAQQGQFSIEDRDATTPYIKKVRVVSTVEYYLSD